MLDRIRLVVATPCFGGQVSSIYASSLFAVAGSIMSDHRHFTVILRRSSGKRFTAGAA